MTGERILTPAKELSPAERSGSRSRSVRPGRLGALGLVGILAMGCVSLAGCGYRAGLELPSRWDDVGVEIFDNDGRDTLVPNLERDLHGELTAAVRRVVQGTLVDPSKADVVIRGRIIEYRRRQGIRTRDNRRLETGIRVRVRGELWERTGGDPEWVLLRHTVYTTHSGYLLEDRDEELDAQDRVLRNIADRLVLDLFAPEAYIPGP